MSVVNIPAWIRVVFFMGMALIGVLLPLCLFDLGEVTFVVEQLGYWIILAEVLIFSYFVWKYISAYGRQVWAGLVRHRWYLLLVVLPVAVFMLIHEPFMFRIQSDEFSISSMAQSMHYERISASATKAHELMGSLQLTDFFVNKRPLFFPFLICCLHDLTGYRPENVFILNALLGFVFLATVYFIGCRLSGVRLGVLSVLLFAGLPLLSENITSGGFDICSLTLLAILIYLCILNREVDDFRYVPFIIFIGAFLGESRYESSVYAVVAYGWIFFKALELKRFQMSFWVVLSPLLFSLPLFSFRLIQEIPSLMQTDAGRVWSLEFFEQNIVSAVYFLFDFSDGQDNSLLLSLIGGACLVGFFVRSASSFKETFNGTKAVAASFALMIFVMTFMLLFYFWGKWDDPMVTRLSLPFHLMFILFLGVLWDRFRISDKVWRYGIIPCVLVSLLVSISVRVRGEATGRMISAGSFTFMTKEIQRLSHGNKALVISDSPMGPILYGFPSISNNVAVQVPEKVAWLYRSAYYQDIYVVEQFHVWPDGRVGTHYGINYMGTNKEVGERLAPIIGLRDEGLEKYFKFKVISSKRVSSVMQVRISKIVGIRPGVEFKPLDLSIPQDSENGGRNSTRLLEKYIELLP